MKLDYDQMQEVNRLIEAAQDDLESVLFELVGQRDAAVEALKAVRKQVAVHGNVHPVLTIIDAALAKIST